jgi:transcriptional regulator with XRE-family HTH domain
VPGKSARGASKTANPKVVFGIVLRELRRKHCYSQDEFAHLAGYHRNFIGQLERGEKSPSLGALFNFAQSLGMKPSEILKLMERQIG